MTIQTTQPTSSSSFFLSGLNLVARSSSLGGPGTDALRLSSAEVNALATQLLLHPGPPHTIASDAVLLEGAPVDPMAYHRLGMAGQISSLSDWYPIPYLGFVVTAAATNFSRPVGATFSLSWRFKSQFQNGYPNVSTTDAPIHTAVIEIAALGADTRDRSALLGVIPAQVLQGKTVMSLAYALGAGGGDTDFIRADGIPAGVTLSVRSLTRREPYLARLWPQLAAQAGLVSPEGLM